MLLFSFFEYWSNVPCHVTGNVVAIKTKINGARSGGNGNENLKLGRSEFARLRCFSKSSGYGSFFNSSFKDVSVACLEFLTIVAVDDATRRDIPIFERFTVPAEFNGGNSVRNWNRWGELINR